MSPNVDRQLEPRTRDEQERAIFRRTVLAVIITASATLFVSFLVGLAAFTYVVDRVDLEATDRARTNCASQVVSRQALRAVIVEATAPTSPSVVLPPDPNVDPATIAYLQRLVDSSTATASASTRSRLLGVAPALRCTDNGETRELK